MQGSPTPPTAAERPSPGARPPATPWLVGARAALVRQLKRLARGPGAGRDIEHPEGDDRVRIVLTGARTSKLVQTGTEPS